MKTKLSHVIQSKFNIFIYLTLGWGFARFYIFSLGKLYYIFNKKEKEIINNAIADVAGRIRREIDLKEVTGRVFQGIFSHYYEKMFIAFGGHCHYRALWRD